MFVTIPLSITETTVQRYIAKVVTDDLMRLTGIDSNTPILFNERRGEGKNLDSSNSSSQTPVNLDTQDRLTILYNDVPDDRSPNLTKLQREYPPVFNAPELGVRLYPHHRKNAMEFRVVYQSRSYNTLSVWLDRFRDNLALRDQHNFHDLKYVFTIPPIVVAYIHDVWALTELNAPYGRTLKEFMDAYFTKGLVVRKNNTGSQKQLAINTDMQGTLGYYTSIPEEIETDKERAVCSIEFSYRLEYDKVSALVLDFQTYIHNKRIDKQYHDLLFPPKRPVHPNGSGLPNVVAPLYKISDSVTWKYVNPEDVFFDKRDMWFPKKERIRSTTTMKIVPIQISPDNVRELLSLNDFKRFSDNTDFWQAIIEICQAFPKEVVTTYGFPIQLELYAVGEKEYCREIEIDSAGTISATSDLNLRERHYLRLSIISDLALVLDSLQLLLKLPSYLQFIVGILDPSLEIKTNVGGTIVDMPHLKNEVIPKIQSTNFHYKTHLGFHRYHTVEITSIIAKRKE